MSGRGGRSADTGRGMSGQGGPKIAILATVAAFVILLVLAPRGGRQQQEESSSAEAPAPARVEAMEPGGDFPLSQEPSAGVGYDLPATSLPDEPGDSAVAELTL